MQVSELCIIQFDLISIYHYFAQIFCEEVAFYENYDLDNIVTPVKVNVNVLRDYLVQLKYDERKTQFLVDGFYRWI